MGLALGALSSASLLVLGVAGQAASTYKVKTLVTGLASPRGVAIAPNGQLVLSEAGRGGSGPCITAGSGNEVCYGDTGALGLFDFSTNAYSRALTNLPSLAQQSAPLYPEATGLNKLTFDASGQLYGVFGFDGTADPSSLLSPGSQWFGRTVTIDLLTNTVTPLGNIAAFENAQNPDGQNTASNPWDLVKRGGDTYVTDAGANTLVKVDSTNQVSLVHVFPNKNVNTPTNAPLPRGFPAIFSAQAVPTGLTIGPDGALYIAQLSGFPFAPGSADVFRYDFVNGVTTFASGFSNLVDIATGPDNSLYLLQYSNDFWAAPSGSILKLGLDGSVEKLFSDLANPTALAVAPDGKIYVANNSDGVNGELLQLTPVSSPGPLPLLGVGAAFGYSRKLRKRIKIDKLPVSSANA
jgi:hypothetical protein